jgi:ParB-like chromosome segregation protein Spo0J
MQIKIENIIVPEGHRPVDPEKVAGMAASIKVVGLLSPIGVRRRGDAPVELVFGGHRLAACASLGMETIEAIAVDGLGWDQGRREDTDINDFVKMAEITENLHRSDLTTQQRNEQIAEWVALFEKRKADIGDVRQYPASKPGRKPSAAIADVAKASGIGVKTIKEAVAASKVSPAVKAAADAAELTSKQRLKISRLPECEQLDAVAREAADDAADRVADAFGDTMRSVRSAIEAALSAYEGCDDAADQRARLFAGLYSLLENLDRPARKPEAAA